MKKQTKMIIAIVAVVLVATIIGGIIMLTQNKEQEPRYTMDEIREVYWWQHKAFVMAGDYYEHHTYQEDSTTYVYTNLACYEKETGNKLTINEIRDYLSSEYEEDGELRLYISGDYPNIQNYIEWYKKNEETLKQYKSALVNVLVNYEREKEAAGESVPKREWDDLTLEQMQELVKKEADPSYELNLENLD